jgi:protein TonB
VPDDSRLFATLAVSVAVHAMVLAGVAAGRLSLPVPGRFEIMEVTLTGVPARSATATPPQAPASTPPALAGEATAGSRADRTGGETPLVEARHQAAGLDNPRPVYPLAARRRGLEGRVLLSVHVRADGSCAEVQLRQSSGHALLDDSALATVRRWRFLPATRAGQAMDSWVDVPVSFRLNG